MRRKPDPYLPFFYQEKNFCASIFLQGKRLPGLDILPEGKTGNGIFVN